MSVDEWQQFIRANKSLHTYQLIEGNIGNVVTQLDATSIVTQDSGETNVSTPRDVGSKLLARSREAVDKDLGQSTNVLRGAGAGAGRGAGRLTVSG